MKILLSIKPEYVHKIFSGEKKFEYRKSIFKNQLVKTIVVYSTMPEGKIIGEFEIGDVLQENPASLWDKTWKHGGVEQSFFDEYFWGREKGYAISVKKVMRYAEPLDPRHLFGKFTAPQSFMYLKEEQAIKLAHVIT
ncbi:ASCH domain-containing protein [Shewanella sp. 0m-11]